MTAHPPFLPDITLDCMFTGQEIGPIAEKCERPWTIGQVWGLVCWSHAWV